MNSGSVNPLAQEEKKMEEFVARIKQLESQLNTSQETIKRLQEMIYKCHAETFPDQVKPSMR